MNRRVAIVKHYMEGRRNNTGFFDMLRIALGAKCAAKAKRYITAIEPDGEYLKIYIRGLAEPLYWPADENIHYINQVVTEQFHAGDWHRYQFAGTLLTPDDTVIDCGAAEGLFSLLAAKKCRKVLAIEPVQKFITALRRTFAKMPNVTVVPLALGDKAGTAYLTGSGNGCKVSDETAGEKIELITLDELAAREKIKPSYIKADLEGYELKMLEGAKETIKTCAPKVAITTYHIREHAEAIRAFLSALRPDYRFKVKGIEERHGSPVMLHAWTE